MRSIKEIIDRINHIKNLSDGYGINSRRIKELEWVLNDTKKCNHVGSSIVIINEDVFKECKICGDLY